MSGGGQIVACKRCGKLLIFGQTCEACGKASA